MHKKTDERIKAILDMELANFTFTKQTASAVTAVASHVVQAADKETVPALNAIIDHLNESREEFVRSIMQSQTEMSKTMTGFLDTTDTDQISDIMRRTLHHDQPDCDSFLDEE